LSLKGRLIELNHFSEIFIMNLSPFFFFFFFPSRADIKINLFSNFDLKELVEKLVLNYLFTT
jgi:hypothetical protein